MDEKQEAAIAAWYDVPFIRGLTEPALIAGVPKNVLVFNGIFAIFLIMNFGFFYILIVTLLFHFVAMYVCKGDNQFFDCLKSYKSKEKYYTV